MFSFNSRHLIRTCLRLSFTWLVLSLSVLHMEVHKSRITKKYYLHNMYDLVVTLTKNWIFLAKLWDIMMPGVAAPGVFRWIVQALYSGAVQRCTECTQCTAVQSAGTVSQSNSHSHVPPALWVNSDTAFIADRQWHTITRQELECFDSMFDIFTVFI